MNDDNPWYMYSDDEHTPPDDDISIDDTEWLAQWPKHCKKCMGWGEHTHHYDPSPSGISLSSGYMTDISPCDCTDNGICPRCSAEDLDVETPTPCAACGWNWGKGYDDGAPGARE